MSEQGLQGSAEIPVWDTSSWTKPREDEMLFVGNGGGTQSWLTAYLFYFAFSGAEVPAFLEAHVEKMRELFPRAPHAAIFCDTAGETPGVYQQIEQIAKLYEAIGTTHYTTQKKNQKGEPVALYDQALNSALHGTHCDTLPFRIRTIRPKKFEHDEHQLALFEQAEMEGTRLLPSHENGTPMTIREILETGTYTWLVRRVHPLNTKCSYKFKGEEADALRQRFMKVFGFKRCVNLLSMASNEERRMRPAREALAQKGHRFAFHLRELGIDDQEGISILNQLGHEDPERSACFFCPNMNKKRRAKLFTKYPELHAKAIALDEAIGEFGVKGFDPKVTQLFLDNSFKRLSAMNFNPDDPQDRFDPFLFDECQDTECGT